MCETVAAISAAVQEIRWEDMKLGEILGSGGFADVYKAEWRGDYVAVKVIKNQRDDDAFRLQFQQESLFLRWRRQTQVNFSLTPLIASVWCIGSKMRHYNVVQLIGVCAEISHMSIIMELMENNTLDHLLSSTRKENRKYAPALSGSSWP